MLLLDFFLKRLKVSSGQSDIDLISLSKSEIVVPLIKEGHLFGVLDVDSPEKGRFGEGERVLLERAASLISDSNLPEHLKVFAERE